MSRVVILVGSVCKGGNTELLAGAFAEGARLHNEVEIVSVADYRIHPCTGCNCCFSNEDHVCVQNDDMALIYEKLRNTDTLVVASPVYFYGISAQLKAMIDRLHTPMRNSFSIRQLGLIMVGAATMQDLFDPYPLTESGSESHRNRELAAAAGELMKAKYSYSETEALLSEAGFLIYEHMNAAEATKAFFQEYNHKNAEHVMTAPEGVGYCLAVKKQLAH